MSLLSVSSLLIRFVPHLRAKAAVCWSLALLALGTLQASATPTAEDLMPTAVCQNITVYLDGSGNASITAADVDNGSSAPSGIKAMGVSPSSFTCSSIGSNTVTLTVVDNNSNISQCMATVTVVDSTSPTAVCQNLTVYLDGSGNASVTAGDIDGGSSDNCSLASLGLSNSSFTCADIGSNAVTFTVTDLASNTSQCTAVVTVVDSTSPTAVCQNLTVYLDGSGNASVTAGDIDGGSSDNCSLASLGLSNSSFTCADVGSNTVTFTATDLASNTSQCTAVVTVVDSTSPTAVCQNITVYLDGSGNASIAPRDVNGGSSDNCGLTSVGLNKSSFTCADIGANTVTFTATDIGGNTSSCTATVTVLDTTSPTAVCQNLTVQLDATGNANVLATSINDGSSDNCGLAAFALSPGSFTCAEIGTNPVTFTATDVSGNTSTCTATVTVQDAPDPSPCTPVPVELITFRASIGPGTDNQPRAVLYWATATETDNLGFEVQRSTDLTTWNSLAWVDGNGSSLRRNDYTAVDEAPVAGVNYYRLQQVDVDGTTSYSAVEHLELETRAERMRLFPNPSAGRVTLQWTGGGEEPLRYQLFDALGRVVLAGETQSRAGAPLELDFTRVAAGLYRMQVQQGGYLQSVPLVLARN